MQRTSVMGWVAGVLGALAGVGAGPAAVGAPVDARADGTLVLVEQGVSRAPIVLFKGAPPLTRQAAEHLAQYIEKVSGARPPILDGAPDPLPERAIWVGFQPPLAALFPSIDFNFQHPEEILVAATTNHLVIAGRDRWDPAHLAVRIEGKRRTVTVDGVQREYGTANAVYTFLQDYLGVRWLWPGELGEDIRESKTIAFEPFVYRYHPSIRGRAPLFVFSMLLQGSGYGISRDWVRFQRLQLDSLEVHMGHAFKDWWDRFHEKHPDYFALQPDGTRSGFPAPEAAKICESNPAVREEWLNDVADQLRKYPNRTVFNAAPNDGYNQGNCVCDNCRAWDDPGAEQRLFIWQGLTRKEVALSDREVTFANTLARLLKKRYPDKDYAVSTLAYGFSRPAPIKAVPDGNVVIVDVANMFWSLDSPDKDCPKGTLSSAHYAGWGRITTNHVWRPNTGNPAGWQNALPDVPIERVMASFRFAVSNRCVGIGVDSVWEQWANQGPLYYVLGKMAWDPGQDWRAVLDDYYRRGFGPAAADIKAYWELMEAARNRKVDEFPGEENGYAQVYDKAFFDRAYGLLDRAARNAGGVPGKYAGRVAFVRAGLDATKLMADIRVQCGRILKNGADAAEAAERARVKWTELEQLCQANPIALSWGPIRPGTRMARGALFHPDSMPAKKSAAAYRPPAGPAAILRSAEAAGWELVFQDDFERTALGDDWKILQGSWTVDQGALRGSGLLASTRGFPGDGAAGYQRMEFDAVTDVPLQSPGEPPAVSDLSAVLHGSLAGDPPDPIDSGYFFQFGWKMNKRNRISREGQPIVADNAPRTLIQPGKTHRIVVENDGGALRLFVDGALVIAHWETDATLKPGHGHVALYCFTAARIMNVKVYVKPQSSGLDTE